MKKNILSRIVDRIVYSTTKKPRHYVEVRNPPRTPIEKLKRPQDARQMQYNRWSKRFHIYSGSYLPKDHRELFKSGWEEVRNLRSGKQRFYRRKSSHQTIRFDEAQIKKNRYEKAHYHWYIWWKSFFSRKEMCHFLNAPKNHKIYYNEYGEKTCFYKKDHHISAKDCEQRTTIPKHRI